ncbi:hypothetical protein [Nocardioides caldifontis]|uniref:hypothetical protein n=1 Tax=Nocardioides caldifontis TaxID=2588938 RepID=UPI0011DF7609|nr:hypothetical protein [Nocardioides caldifontis]
MAIISSISDPATIAARRTGVAHALTATGVVLALNGALLGSRLFLDSRDYSEVAASGLHLTHYLVWTLCLVALSQLYPRLRSLNDAGSRLSTTALVVAGAGAALDACARFVSAFVTPYLAAQQPAMVDGTPDAILLVPLLATGAVAMVGAAMVGVSGWRHRVFPRAAAALLVLGGVAIPVLGPVSNVLLGGALAWIGLSAGARR